MANLPIEERLLHYFLAMGAQQTESSQIPQNNLAFLTDSEKVHVVILRNEDVVQRNKVIETILSLTSLRSSSQLLYLAAPRLLGASIDAAIFRSHGLGLLLFDERRIDEAVAPQPLQPTKPEQEQPQSLDPGLFAELASLKSMYAEMERTIANLREDMKAFQRESESRPRTAELTGPSHIVPPEPMFAGATVSGAPLPPFFANNPWLDVLSRRGRSGNEPIAG